MTQSSEPEDAQWLDAVAGKPDPTASPDINRQGAALRVALHERHRALEQQVPKADSVQYRQLLVRLQREGLRKGRTLGWRPLTLFVISAFVAGSFSTRMILLTTTNATRSSSSIVSLSGTNDGAQTVIVKVEDPSKTVQLAVSEAIRLGLAVAVDSDGESYRMLINSFVPYSPDQDGLRATLGISKSASGALLFLISKKTAP